MFVSRCGTGRGLFSVCMIFLLHWSVLSISDSEMNFWVSASEEIDRLNLMGQLNLMFE